MWCWRSAAILRCNGPAPLSERSPPGCVPEVPKGVSAMRILGLIVAAGFAVAVAGTASALPAQAPRDRSSLDQVQTDSMGAGASYQWAQGRNDAYYRRQDENLDALERRQNRNSNANNRRQNRNLDAYYQRQNQRLDEYYGRNNQRLDDDYEQPTRRRAARPWR